MRRGSRTCAAVVRELTLRARGAGVPRGPRAGDARAPRPASRREPALHGGALSRGQAWAFLDGRAIRAAGGRPDRGAGGARPPAAAWTSTGGCGAPAPTRSSPGSCDGAPVPTRLTLRALEREPLGPSLAVALAAGGRGHRGRRACCSSARCCSSRACCGRSGRATACAASATSANCSVIESCMGEDVELRVSVWNDKLLPLAWLEAEDLVTEGTIIRERAVDAERPAGLLGPAQHLDAGPLRAGHDPLPRYAPTSAASTGSGPCGSRSRTCSARDVAVEFMRAARRRCSSDRAACPSASRRPSSRRSGRRARATGFTTTRPCSRAFGRTRRAIRVDRSIGARRPGWAARSRSATSRRRCAERVIALDMQTNEEPYWMMLYEEEVLESLVVAAASIARFMLDEGGAVGLTANAWSGTLTRIAFVAPATGQAQLPAILDTAGPAQRVRLGAVRGAPGRPARAARVGHVRARAVGARSGGGPRGRRPARRERLPGDARCARRRPRTCMPTSSARAGLQARVAANLDRGWRDERRAGARGVTA